MGAYKTNSGGGFLYKASSQERDENCNHSSFFTGFGVIYETCESEFGTFLNKTANIFERNIKLFYDLFIFYDYLPI